MFLEFYMVFALPRCSMNRRETRGRENDGNIVAWGTVVGPNPKVNFRQLPAFNHCARSKKRGKKARNFFKANDEWLRAGKRAIQSVRGADLRHARNTSENSNRNGDILYCNGSPVTVKD